MNQALEEVKKLQHDKNYNAVVRICDLQLDRCEENLNAVFHEARATALYELKEYGEALRSFEFLLKQAGAKAKGVLFRMARTSAAKALGLGSNEEAEFWGRCSGAESVPFHRAYQAALHGRTTEARTHFRTAIEHSTFADDTQHVWLNSFDVVCDVINGKPVDAGEAIPPVDKIFVSGMGWSGSGALFAYFNEFDAVGCHVESELRYIQGSASLYSLYRELNSEDGRREQFLSLFFNSLLGFNGYRGSHDFLAMREARKTSLSKAEGLPFAKAVNQVMRKASPFFTCDDDEREFEYRRFATDLVNLLSSGAYASSFERYLFDNCISINNLEAIGFIDDVTVFACFRDPRSNYVALRNENFGYRDDANAFIKEKEVRYRLFNEKVSSFSKEYNSSTKKVVRVQFERFVLDEAYRDELARSIGLDLDTRDKHKYFKPWESEKNVYLHETWDDQEEIMEIESALAEYCVNIHELRQEVQK